MLSKSYLDKTDRSRSPPQDRVLYDLFKRVYKQGRITEFVNLQTGERVDNGYILQQSDKYAKGLLSLDTLETGADCMLMVGCYSLEALAVRVACLSIGISVVPKLVFLPREKMIESIVAMAKPKVILVGDAADGEIVKALLSLIHSNSENPSSEKLRGVEHVFYEGVNNSHLQNYPFIKSLDDMIQQGQSIEDQELERIRCTVQPEHITQMVFSTGTTGECKGSLHTHRSFLEHIGKPGFISNGHVCLTENINRSGFVALTRTAFNLAGKTDKLVFSSDVSKNTTGEGVAKISGDSIIDERVTIVVLLPMDLDKLCEYMADTYPNAKQVRSTLLFGQVYTKKFKQKVEESLGGKTVTIYGLSEIPKVGVSPIGSSESDEKDRLEARLILSDGGVMRIVDENDCIVDTETAGRIQLKSRYIFKEYKDLINVTEQAFTEDGFYKTNDIGIMYPDGKFSIIGRESLRTCLYVRRFKLMPSPIEDIVSTHKSIRDVKVVSGTRTADTGDEIVYCIRTEKGSQDISWQEVIQHCKEKQMMELKFPKRILFFDEFPQTKNGRKTDVNFLKELVLQRISSDKYAKGLLSLDTLETGVDCILAIGCYTLEALAVLVACLSIGVSVLPKLVFLPREISIEESVNLYKPKVVLVGDAADGEIVKSLLSLFHSTTASPVSEKLHGVKHVIYEGLNLCHLQNYPFMKSLDDMIRLGQSIGDQELERMRCTVQPDHISQAVFSTGSTGASKGILHTHRSFLEQIGQPVLTSNGYVCITENMNRAGFVALTRTALNLAGKTDKLFFSPDISMNKTKEEVAKICGDSIIDECVTLVVLLPRELDKLCDYMADTYPNVKQVRLTLLFGQTFTKKLKQRVEKSLGGKTVTLYGMSEIPTVGVTPFGSSESDEKDRMEGKIILSHGSVMRIVNDKDCIVDIETEGRIQVKSTYMFNEYKAMTNATEQAFTKDGFYKTGDIGIMYPDGKFSIIGRESLRTCLYVRRFKLMPSPIEDIVSTHRSIKDVKVVSGTRTADTGDEIVYCIRMENGAKHLIWQEVINHCREKQMMELKFPRRILFFDEFPQTENGRKTDVNFLRELVLQRISENPEEGIVPGVPYTQ